MDPFGTLGFMKPYGILLSSLNPRGGFRVKGLGFRGGTIVSQSQSGFLGSKA